MKYLSCLKTKNDPNLPEKIAKLKKYFFQLKSACSQPRLYIVDYFANLINEVDIVAETFLAEQKNQTKEISMQARSDQSKIIETIKKRQDELLGSKFEEDLELLDKIRDIGLRLENPISSNDIPVIGLQIEKTMLGLQRKIFTNKSLWFWVWEYFDKEETDLSSKRFGQLIVLEDEFLPINPDTFEYG